MTTRTRLGIIAGAVVLATLWGGISYTQGAAAPEAKKLTLTSAAFEYGALIPRKYSGEGLDISPPLRWTDPPAGTKMLALTCEDPDASRGPFIHWVAWGINPSITELPEALPNEKILSNGMRQGANGFDKVGYGGPMPPVGSDHRYFFRILAVNVDVALPGGATKKELESLIKKHIIAQGELMGRFKR